MISVVASAFTLPILRSQELYPATEAASNGPKDVVRVRAMAMTQNTDVFTALKAMYSVSSEVMFAGTTTFSSRLPADFPATFGLSDPLLRSVTLYGKWRFYTDDKPHQHLRMALFGEYDAATQSVSHETYMMGVKNGATLGVVGTLLLNRTALSLTASWFAPLPLGARTAAATLESNILNYSLSVGQLLLPVRYTSYEEVNLNVYVEALGMVYDNLYHGHQLRLDVPGGVLHTEYSRRAHVLMLAPAIQCIVDSRMKIDLSARLPIVTTNTMTDNRQQQDVFRRAMLVLGVEYYFF
jgi:hypothetical protein